MDQVFKEEERNLSIIERKIRIAGRDSGMRVDAMNRSISSYRCFGKVFRNSDIFDSIDMMNLLKKWFYGTMMRNEYEKRSCC